LARDDPLVSLSLAVTTSSHHDPACFRCNRLFDDTLFLPRLIVLFNMYCIVMIVREYRVIDAVMQCYYQNKYDTIPMSSSCLKYMRWTYIPNAAEIAEHGNNAYQLFFTNATEACSQHPLDCDHSGKCDFEGAMDVFGVFRTECNVRYSYYRLFTSPWRQIATAKILVLANLVVAYLYSMAYFWQAEKDKLKEHEQFFTIIRNHTVVQCVMFVISMIPLIQIYFIDYNNIDDLYTCSNLILACWMVYWVKFLLTDLFNFKSLSHCAERLGDLGPADHSIFSTMVCHIHQDPKHSLHDTNVKFEPSGHPTGSLM
jgi:hypothetical protein